ncbi:MAG: methionyl-tRNA formyltransferase [Verrucomicrobiota bacterium]
MKVLFVGTGEIGVPSLAALLEEKRIEVVGVVTQPNRPVGRKQQLAAPPVKTFVEKHGILLYQPERINHPDVLEGLAALKPDLAVVCAYGQILKPGILELPRLGCLNIHASLLPKYRGAACIQAAIRDGEQKTGVTIMWMDEGLDTGDILMKREVEIRQGETAGMLHDRIAELAPDVLLEALQMVEQGTAPRVKQDETMASYVGRLKKEDGVVDWSQSAVAIDCHIRAMTPWPSAYTWITLGEPSSRKILKLHKVKPAERSGDQGKVIEVAKDFVSIGTGEGSLEVYEMQLEGKRRLPCQEFLKGHHLREGQYLG